MITFHIVLLYHLLRFLHLSSLQYIRHTLALLSQFRQISHRLRLIKLLRHILLLVDLFRLERASQAMEGVRL